MFFAGKLFNIKDKKRREEDKYVLSLFENYVNELMALGLSYTNDKELIKDVIQDLFLDLLDHKERLRKVDNIKIYLFISLRNNLISAINKSKRFADYESVDNLTFQGPEDDSLPFSLQGPSRTDQQNKSLKENLAKLSRSQQQIIQLRFFHQLSYKEIGSIRSINYQSARTLLYRAIKKLRKEYKKRKKE